MNWHGPMNIHKLKLLLLLFKLNIRDTNLVEGDAIIFTETAEMFMIFKGQLVEISNAVHSDP